MIYVNKGYINFTAVGAYEALADITVVLTEARKLLTEKFGEELAFEAIATCGQAAWKDDTKDGAKLIKDMADRMEKKNRRFESEN